ncbi:hypothetical protein ABPG72_021926 [Tetrahymena utriculariae]
MLNTLQSDSSYKTNVDEDDNNIISYKSQDQIQKIQQFIALQQITQIDQHKDIIELTIKFQPSSLGRPAMKLVAQLLRDNKKIQFLNLQLKKNQIHILDLKDALSSISELREIKNLSLSLQQTGINQIGASFLNQQLYKMKQINSFSLNLKDNPLKQEGVQEIIKLLYNFMSLQSLRLNLKYLLFIFRIKQFFNQFNNFYSKCEMDNQGFKNLTILLLGFQNLKLFYLDVGQNYFYPIESIVHDHFYIISQIPNLQFLHIGNQEGYLEKSYFQDILHNLHLTELSLKIRLGFTIINSLEQLISDFLKFKDLNKLVIYYISQAGFSYYFQRSLVRNMLRKSKKLVSIKVKEIKEY